MEWNIPAYVENIINKLEDNGFNAYIVGGSVRDILLRIIPKDYDITTDATPSQILQVFKEYKTLEVGKKFGTVVVIQEEGNIEVTTFRSDGNYLDGRRPEEVYFSKNLLDDLSRRDFTINAMAYNKNIGLIDYFNGKEDLEKKSIRAVGNPKDRLKEDILRIMRAIRFATELDFSIEEKTYEACKEYGKLISNISMERIQSELFKILLSEKPSYGIRLLKEVGILELVFPEMMKAVGFNQLNPHHDKDVFEHILCVLDKVEPIIHLRLAALLHDIGKPYTLTVDENGIGHFYDHEKIGAKMAKEILQRWKVSNETIEKVCILIYKHMTQHANMKEKGLKRLIAYVGKDEIFTLFKLQKADRSCSNEEADIADIQEREEKVKNILENNEVCEKKQLVIDGNDVIELGYKEGKKIGEILDYLLERVLENPELNEKEKLIKLIKDKE